MVGVLCSVGVVALLLSLTGEAAGLSRSADGRAGGVALVVVALPALAVLLVVAAATGATTGALLAGAAAGALIGGAALGARRRTPLRPESARPSEIAAASSLLDMEIERHAA